ncbi:MAG TPA: DUF4912 domain-containing protein [Bacillota bacterium]|nr:DUF4912 domain-containing protein [Bacillota bacterium]
MAGQQNATIGLLQDLKNLFVYWDFSPERLGTLRDFLRHVKPHMRFCLRLIGIEDNNFAIPMVEREVYFEDLEAYGRYYFYGVNPDLNYRFELGGKEPSGNFLLFSRSELMELHPLARNQSPVGIALSSELNWESLAANQSSSSSY